MGAVLLASLGACARPSGPPSPAAPDAAVVSRPEPVLDASVAAPAVEVRLAVRKPLRLSASGLTGGLVVTLTHPGTTPVDVVHPDVHGLRFVDTTTGATHTVLHPCDCAFVLGLDPYPESRRLRLTPGTSTEVLLDTWDCGGGPFRLPPPGRYRVSWRLAAPAVTDGLGMQRLEERCQEVLRRDDVWTAAPESNAVELEISKETSRSRK
ncbi:hypothetical protein [Pyxidicoccus xibeiensis]|uniref:hypothetical protein n=1 Tax=Pyxidicoccus xibeiensis TaxID=2906759 RepID=UPI0020A6E96F|nr:hypothetical protein [Pyxidicoccus xibeiensis]MCP3141870.1 hypothetical protein [Pyxidicoccus xibeiensis]